ncbi:hypothetical protein FCR2A7T_07230 [Flavobacterium cauense R2A-7]|uniref:Uncharacterized protein n=1 Tax=Flavobacterium cauense R2A-7 TaxID=1341154 RepID=V6S3X3_9FLAO|nr:hypothetical protein [Flavobacterium cauense]ESU20952.1 hypothetical protein FCR2A7T_07230 [Flavobacterium cauense R2A-7]KGO79627.1 hypothetical protein Q762_14110 [Flavobacterium cauense R2A-7]TWI08376.1 hypothetical protein IP98_02796 [Flavobacterium cauense R2A-7]
MTITNKDLKLIIPFILFVALGVYGMYSVNYISVSQTMKATFSWCLIPSIAFALYYAYFSTFGYKKISVSLWRKIIGFIAMTIITGLIALFSFQGILMIINSKLGNQKEYLLSGKIIKLNYPKKKKSGNKYSIEIERKLENDTIELNVPTNEYQIGQNFEKQMKIGSLNFIYIEK